MKTTKQPRTKTAAKPKTASKSLEVATPATNGMSTVAMDPPSLADNHPTVSDEIQTEPQQSDKSCDLTDRQLTVLPDEPILGEHSAVVGESETAPQLSDQPGHLTEAIPTEVPQAPPLSDHPPIVEEICKVSGLPNQPGDLTDLEPTVAPDELSLANHPVVLEEIQAARELFNQLGELTDTQTIDRIKDHSGRFVTFSLDKVRSALLATINAWLCGTLLIRTKKQKGHKTFGAWRKEHLTRAGICERTTQRHMALAKKYATIDEVVAAGGPRSVSPQADTGVGQETAESASRSEGKSKAKALLFSGLRGLEKSLRRLTGSNEKLDEDELGELRLMKEQLDELFQQVLSFEGPGTEVAR